MALFFPGAVAGRFLIFKGEWAMTAKAKKTVKTVQGDFNAAAPKIVNLGELDEACKAARRAALGEVREAVVRYAVTPVATAFGVVEALRGKTADTSGMYFSADKDQRTERYFDARLERAEGLIDRIEERYPAMPEALAKAARAGAIVRAFSSLPGDAVKGLFEVSYVDAQRAKAESAGEVLTDLLSGKPRGWSRDLVSAVVDALPDHSAKLADGSIVPPKKKGPAFNS